MMEYKKGMGGVLYNVLLITIIIVALAVIGTLVMNAVNITEKSTYISSCKIGNVDNSTQVKCVMDSLHVSESEAKDMLGINDASVSGEGANKEGICTGVPTKDCSQFDDSLACELFENHAGQCTFDDSQPECSYNNEESCNSDSSCQWSTECQGNFCGQYTDQYMCENNLMIERTTCSWNENSNTCQDAGGEGSVCASASKETCLSYPYNGVCTTNSYCEYNGLEYENSCKGTLTCSALKSNDSCRNIEGCEWKNLNDVNFEDLNINIEYRSKGCFTFNNVGLVAYYCFDGDTLDSSGNGNDGYVNGSLDYETVIDETYAKFNGLTYVNVPASDSLSINDFTISYWIKPAKNSDSQSVINKMKFVDKIANTRNNIHINETYGDYGMFIINAGGGVGNLLVFNSTIYPPKVEMNENWHNVVITRFGGGAFIFVDGKFVENINITRVNTNQNITIGAILGPDGKYTKYLNGSLDNMMIYNRSLNESEINALYIEKQEEYGKLGYNIDKNMIDVYEFSDLSEPDYSLAMHELEKLYNDYKYWFSDSSTFMNFDNEIIMKSYLNEKYSLTWDKQKEYYNLLLGIKLKYGIISQISYNEQRNEFNNRWDSQKNDKIASAYKDNSLSSENTITGNPILSEECPSILFKMRMPYGPLECGAPPGLPMSDYFASQITYHYIPDPILDKLTGEIVSCNYYLALSENVLGKIESKEQNLICLSPYEIKEHSACVFNSYASSISQRGNHRCYKSGDPDPVAVTFMRGKYSVPVIDSKVTEPYCTLEGGAVFAQETDIKYGGNQENNQRECDDVDHIIKNNCPHTDSTFSSVKQTASMWKESTKSTSLEGNPVPGRIFYGVTNEEGKEETLSGALKLVKYLLEQPIYNGYSGKITMYVGLDLEQCAAGVWWKNKKETIKIVIGFYPLPKVVEDEEK